MMKIKLTRSNLISKTRTNTSQMAYFTRGVSEVSDDFEKL
jgi:hypothetical protein